MGKHTDGPWVLELEGHYTPGCGEHPHIVAADGTVVMDGEWYSSVPDLDNARLFCAAPDLLEALEEAMSMLGERLIKDTLGYEWNEKATAAIARARGEA